LLLRPYDDQSPKQEIRFAHIMTTNPPSFSFGISYRPRRSGFDWWDAVDQAELRDELAHIAYLGFDTIRLSLTWEQFQPSQRKIGSRAMSILERVLDAARTAKLRVVPLLFPVGMDGLLTLPDWANGASVIDELTGLGGVGPTITVQAAGSATVLSDQRYHPNQTRDLFSYRPLLAAQRYLIGEVVGYFSSHPAIWAWQLGEGFERARRPSSPEGVQAWYTTMANAIHQQRQDARILGVTTIRGLSLKAGPRPEQILASCDMLGITADPPELPGSPRRHTTYAAFVHALTAGLAGQPILVTALGIPTTEQRGGFWANEPCYGRQRSFFYADNEQQATFYHTALDRLEQAGADGVWLAAYADPHPDVWRKPPLDYAPRLRTLGIVDAQGHEKLAAAAIRDFATRMHKNDGTTRRSQPASIDAERYWHDPSRQMIELWNEFESES
jgi:hypothetical protein